MSSFEDAMEVVAAYLDRGDGDATLLDRCVALGEAAIPAVVEILQQEQAVPPLTALLMALPLKDPIAAFTPLAASNHVGVARAGLAALGNSGDERALPILRDALGPWRIAAVSALGELGSPLGIPLLQREAATMLPPGTGLRDARWGAARELLDIELFAEITIAQAKLGDHGAKDLAIQLATLIDVDDPDADADVRLTWVRTLAYLMGPGVAAAVRQATTDPDAEVAKEAMLQALYLGRAQDASAWIAAIVEDRETAPRALWCLEAWAGEHPTGEPGELVSGDDLLRWWERAERRFAPDVCYRLGRPAEIGELIPLLPGDPMRLRRELRVRTGTRAILELREGDAVSPGEQAAVEAWWQVNTPRFPPGKLHRWGRSYEPSAVGAS